MNETDRLLQMLSQADKGTYLVFGNTYCYLKQEEGRSNWSNCRTRGKDSATPFFVLGLVEAANHLGVPWSLS